MGRFDDKLRTVRRGMAVSLALFLAACGSGERPWWDEGSSGRSPSPVSRPIETAPLGGSYVVKRGDSVYSIARAHNVPMRSIIDANRLSAPYNIEVGQRLTIPAGRFHIVQRGETVSGISRQYNVGVAALTSLNRIPPPYTIKVGERLQIPASQHQTQTASSPTAQSGSGVPMARPGMAAGTGAAVASLPPAASTPTVPRDPLPAPPAATGGFQWPIQGKILSTFGPKANGLHNDGINIAAEMGAPVKAAQSGIVAYAGNELKGYGNLLLIRHDNGWVTAYAHNSKLLVSRGDTVMQGQTIAHAGNTGSVVTPQVHFEIRQGAKAIDPQSVIGM